MYHVTNVPADRPKPDWPVVKTSVLRDKTYDGPMVGLETAAFSTTLIKGEKPRRSTYPTSAAPRTKWWRAGAVVELSAHRVFAMHEYVTQKSGARQVQLLLCRLSDDVERDFASALKTLGFQEVCEPHYGSYLPSSRGNEFNHSLWVNLHFLSFVPVSSWDRVARMDGTSSGELVALKPTPGKVAMLSKWLAKYTNPQFPARFRGAARAEPTRKDVERNRKAAGLLADLEPLYRQCATVLRQAGVDLDSSAKKMSEALKSRMLPVCIGCLQEFSHPELAKHLHKHRAHVYSLEQLQKEKELVLRKVSEGSRDAQKVQLIFAVKTASLINMGHKKR